MTDWVAVLALETPLMELLARGSILYLVLLLFIRVMPRRTGGELATMDLIFVVLIAEAAGRSLGDYTSMADGVVLVAVMMGWNYLLNALSFHSALARRLLASPPLQVVRDGQLLRRNMRREYLTEDELMDQLRREGIDDVAAVKAAFVEAEGKITVIPKDPREPPSR